MVPRPRFELGTPGFSVQCSTRLSYLGVMDLLSNIERAMGFEPMTFSLARRRSTTELRPLVWICATPLLLRHDLTSFAIL